MMDSEFLIDQLASRIPPLRVLLEEHEAEYGELLSHVFMGDVSRFACEQYHQTACGAGDARATLALLCSILDTAAKEGDEDVKELVSVSFLENLAADFMGYPDFRAFLGPTLKHELQPILRAYGYLVEPRSDGMQGPVQ
jgi:hypothetical protein